MHSAPPRGPRRERDRLPPAVAIVLALLAAAAAVVVPLALTPSAESPAPLDAHLAERTPASLPDDAAARTREAVLDDEFVADDFVAESAAAPGDTWAPADEAVTTPVWPPPLPPEATPSDSSDRARLTRSPTAQSGAASEPASARAPSEFDRSSDARQRRVEQFGGSSGTESAVEAGLAWLAAHQGADGIWSRFHFSRNCPPADRCTGSAVNRKNIALDAGVTGLCLLAFLGAGYTDERGPYQPTVARAVDALLRLQQADGGFGIDAAQAGYNDSIATLALAEYYEMTRAPGLEHVLERAAWRLAQTQQALGGWDYLPRNQTGRNDTSITAWMVQALQACAVAGVPTPRAALIRSSLHFSRAAQPDGRVWYADTGVGVRSEPDDPQSLAYRYGPAMSAAGLTCEQILGWSLAGPLPQRQRGLLLQDLPSTRLLMGGDKLQLHDYYYWYYGTTAMFQLGQESWERWNARLRDALLPLQDRARTPRGDKKHSFGSWPPFGEKWGRWGRSGSRLYSTAMSVLTLEIYYRHTPAYLEDRVVLTAADWRDFLRNAEPRERRQAVFALRQTRLDVAEPVLADLIEDADGGVAVQAALGLADLNSPLGLATLEAGARTAPLSEKSTLERAARRCREVLSLPAAAGSVRVVDAQRRLATLELSRAYVGMLLETRGGGGVIGKLRVVQRFLNTRVVVAEVLDGLETLAPGDAVAGG